MKSKSIKSKILITLIVFSTFIILLLWESQLLLSRFLYEKYQLRDMEQIASEISNTDSRKLPNYLSGIVYNNNVCIEYVMDDGNSFYY